MHVLLLVALFVTTVSKSRKVKALKCCNLSSSTPERLLGCITRHEANEDLTFHIRKDILLISYVSFDILDYAAYSIGINQMYAYMNNYQFKVYNESDSNYEPRDQRWNRVKLLLNELDKNDDVNPNKVNYIVWFDADLVFLDFRHTIESIIIDNPNVDMILSAERHAPSGVANTGCIIVKKSSAWNRRFLVLWWESFDRTIAHDQMFFDKLYKSMDPSEVERHIKILESHQLNSHPPAALFQDPHHKVLHMMGERSDVRRNVFHSGYLNLCSDNYTQVKFYYLL
jgi:hypothetical protein